MKMNRTNTAGRILVLLLTALLVLSLALFAAASLILGLLSGITVPGMEHITGSIL